MSSLPITFALFALSAAENASVNRNKNLIAGSHRINNSGEEIIQYKRGGQMAVAPHGVLKENSSFRDCMKNLLTELLTLNCFCSSGGRTPPATLPATQPATPTATNLLPGGWVPRDADEYPDFFLQENKILPTSFNIPRIIHQPKWQQAAVGNNVHVLDITELTFFKISTSSVEWSVAEVKLTKVPQHESPDFVYLPYIPNKITCINMADFQQLAVLSDQFTGCWMNTVKSNSGVLERVCHVGSVYGDDSMNSEWNKYIGTLGGNKQIFGFKPADCQDAICDFGYTQNSNLTTLESPRRFGVSLDTMGLVSDGKMYTLVAPRGPTDGTTIQTIPTSYVLRRMINTLNNAGEINTEEKLKVRIARIEGIRSMK